MKIVAYVNNNHCDEYYVEGKRLISLSKIHVVGKDGNNWGEVEVAREQKRVYYGEEEVGGPYPATSYHFFAELYLFGTHFPVDLNKLIPRGVKVYAIEYTTEEQ